MRTFVLLSIVLVGAFILNPLAAQDMPIVTRAKTVPSPDLTFDRVATHRWVQ